MAEMSVSTGTPAAAQRGASSHIARIFDDGHIARIGEHASRDIYRLLGTVDNKDLIGMAAHAARHSGVGGDGLAQPS